MLLKNQLFYIWRCMTHFVYPQLCIGCDKALMAEEQILCLLCDSQLPLTHYHHIPGNETAQRFDGRIPFRHATSLAYYTKDGLLQQVLHEFKYKGNKDAGAFLAKKLGSALKQTEWINSVDLIIPVPLHHKKANIRGYNQSQIIAEHLGAILQIPTNHTLLRRIRNTDTQTKKTRVQRLENMQEAFYLADLSALANKHILLLDDVLTTGATIESCSLVLLQSEGLKVSIATIGIAI